MQFATISGEWTLGKLHKFAKNESLYPVLRDGREVGYITKFRNTRSETHPWKAYAGKGLNSIFLGVVYADWTEAVKMLARAYQS